MTKNIISFAKEYKVDEIGQQAVDQTSLDLKQFVREAIAQLPLYINCKRFGGDDE
jgi:hypothetical protein